MIAHNLRTREQAVYVSASMTSRQAVINAYAQEHGDFNTWDYEERYGNLVRASESGSMAGDWYCYHDGRDAWAIVPAGAAQLITGETVQVDRAIVAR